MAKILGWKMSRGLKTQSLKEGRQLGPNVGLRVGPRPKIFFL
jgi:hypothetical protein